MDQMIINSEFFKEILSRALIKILKKKGYDVNLQIRDLDIKHGEGKTIARASMVAIMEDDQLKMVIKEAI